MKTKTLAIVVVSSLIFAIANSESFAQSNGVYVALSGGPMAQSINLTPACIPILG